MNENLWSDFLDFSFAFPRHRDFKQLDYTSTLMPQRWKTITDPPNNLIFTIILNGFISVIISVFDKWQTQIIAQISISKKHKSNPNQWCFLCLYTASPVWKKKKQQKNNDNESELSLALGDKDSVKQFHRVVRCMETVSDALHLSTQFKALQTIVLFFVFLANILGNICVCLAVIRVSSLRRRPMASILASLALSDIASLSFTLFLLVWLYDTKAACMNYQYFSTILATLLYITVVCI